MNVNIPDANRSFAAGPRVWGPDNYHGPLVLVVLVMPSDVQALNNARDGNCGGCVDKVRPCVASKYADLVARDWPVDSSDWWVCWGLRLYATTDPTEFEVLRKCTEFLTTKAPVTVPRGEEYIQQKLQKYLAPF